MPYLILSYLPALICGIHVVRTGQNMYWIWLLIIGGPLGALIYFFAIMLPDLTGGRTARKVTGAASRLIDPERDYKAALSRLEETPTTDARMKAAHAAAAIGRWEDAERLWEGCATGRWADDATILFGHARALLELSRHGEALERLEKLKSQGRDGETPQAALLFARACEGLGRIEEAEETPTASPPTACQALKPARAMSPSWRKPDGEATPKPVSPNSTGASQRLRRRCAVRRAHGETSRRRKSPPAPANRHKGQTWLSRAVLSAFRMSASRPSLTR